MARLKHQNLGRSGLIIGDSNGRPIPDIRPVRMPNVMITETSHDALLSLARGPVLQNAQPRAEFPLPQFLYFVDARKEALEEDGDAIANMEGFRICRT